MNIANIKNPKLCQNNFNFKTESMDDFMTFIKKRKQQSNIKSLFKYNIQINSVLCFITTIKIHMKGTTLTSSTLLLLWIRMKESILVSIFWLQAHSNQSLA